MASTHIVPKIVVLGSANMDLVVTTDRLPGAGETILGGSFATVPGGKGLNEAIAAARCGGDVEFLGAIGGDTFALELRETLVLEDVGTQLLREVEGPSGIAIVTVERSGENNIIVVPGANATVTDLTTDERVAIAAADIVLCSLEIPLETVVAAAAHARSSGTVVMLNPSPAQPLPDGLLANVDVLVLNHLEAEQLGRTTLDAVPQVVTTLGAAGATYRSADGTTRTVEAVEVEAVDTTGAGDAFTGTLAASWHRGHDDALRWACAAGALATTRVGASASMPTAEQIEAALSLSVP